MPPCISLKGNLCSRAVCLDKAIIQKRINNQVRQPASLYTMQRASCCSIIKSAKLGSYNRVLQRRRLCCTDSGRF